jgi:hypothetical protein
VKSFLPLLLHLGPLTSCNLFFNLFFVPGSLSFLSLLVYKSSLPVFSEPLFPLCSV